MIDKIRSMSELEICQFIEDLTEYLDKNGMAHLLGNEDNDELIDELSIGRDELEIDLEKAKDEIDSLLSKISKAESIIEELKQTLS